VLNKPQMMLEFVLLLERRLMFEVNIRASHPIP
jgi:hypothetical protein